LEFTITIRMSNEDNNNSTR